MNIDKLDLFIERLNLLSITDADKAFSDFKEQWPQFTKDERKILSGVVEGMMLRITVSDVPKRVKLNWLAIAIYSGKPVIDGEVLEEDNDDIFPGLTLADGINVNQITKEFHEWKTGGIITSSWDLIAEGLSIIFKVEYSTAYNDLTQKKRLEKVRRLFT